MDSQAESLPDGNGSAGPGGWLNRNVVGMGLTSLLSDAGHEMATAVLASFLGIIGAPVYALGIIEGVSDALSSFVKLGAGWWSDRLGHRKAIVTIGYALTGGAFVLFVVAVTWPLVLVGRMIAWFGRRIRGPLRDVMLADSFAAGDRGKAFGFHRAGDTLGACRRDIRNQFLLESAMLAGLGGMTGVLAGVAATVAASAFSAWDAAISWESAGIAFVFSVSLGIVFGLYPAIRAASLEPIEALRAAE